MEPDDRQQPARLNVRLDDKLRSRIEAAAQASRRSMNAEICHRIEQAFIEQRPGAATVLHDKPAPNHPGDSTP